MIDFLKTQSPILFLREVLEVDLQDFHIEWLRFVQNNRFTVIMAPRGSGKSTVLTVGYTLWRTLTNRNLRVLIVSNTQRQAEIFLRQIRSYIESPLIMDIYGDIRGNTWTTNELDFKGHGVQKETTITALGVQSALIGRHMDMIMLDDIVDEENSSTEFQRTKLWEWYYKVLLPMLEPDGSLHIIGTRWRENDFYSQIMKSNYATRIYKAINDGKSYWPSKYPIDLLNSLAKQNPTMFAMQYQNEIISPSDAIFKDEYFRYYEELPPYLDYYMGVDLAASPTGDYFAIVVIGKNKEGDIFVVDQYRGHLTLSRQFEKIYYYVNEYDPVMIGIESNAYQLAVANELKNRGLPIKAVSQSKNKESRAMSLSVLFENGKIYFKQRNTDLENELRMFPRGSHDDMFDALEIAVSLVRKRGDISFSSWTGAYVK